MLGLPWWAWAATLVAAAAAFLFRAEGSRIGAGDSAGKEALFARVVGAMRESRA